MEETDTYEYYVLEILNPPYEDFDKFICVPDSWIQVRKKENNIAYVKYPEEDYKITRKRIKRNDKCLAHWSLFEAYVTHGTDSYEDAITHLTKHCNKLNGKRIQAEITRAKRSSVQQANMSVLEPTPCVSGINNHLEEPSTSHDKKIGEKPRRISRQIQELLKLAAFQQLDDMSTLEQIKRILEGPEETSNVTVYRSTNSRHNKQNEAVDRNNPDTEYELNDPDIYRETTFGSDLTDLLMRLHTSFEQKALMHETICHELLAHASMIKQYISLVKRFNDQFSDPIDTTSENVITVDVEKKKNDKPLEHEAETNDSSEEEVILEQRKKRKAKRESKMAKKRNMMNNKEYSENVRERATTSRHEPLILPPEYDENNSRWTLRYQNMKDGLVELVPYSNIFVNDKNLREYKRQAEDSKMLAGMLVQEIFSDNALSTCSITGKQYRSPSEFFSKPGLDEDARIIILNYVDDYAIEKQWPRENKESIYRVFLNKLRLYRKKYNNNL